MQVKTLSRIATLPLAAVLLLCAGCLQLDVNVALQPDGSAVITERLQFSRKLLSLDATAPAELKVSPLLEKPAALARLKRMGEGVELVSHLVRDGEAGSRESVCVFRIADFRKLEYASPFLAFGDYAENCKVKADLFPIYESTWYGRQAGQMAVTFKLTKPNRREPAPKEGEPAPPGPSPLQQQMLRNLQPMARDLMEGLRIKVTFESYAPVRFRQYFRYRNSSARTTRFDLIDFSDDDLDQFGQDLLQNEEVLIELLDGRLGDKNLLAATAEHGTNLTVPVYHPRGVPEIYFAPSRKLFGDFFQGKTLKFEERQGGERPADFEQVGWRAERKNGNGNK